MERGADIKSGSEARAGQRSHVLLVECGDAPGLVHGVTGVLLRHGLNVVRNHEYVDRSLQRFFMRTEFDGEVDPTMLAAQVRQILPPIAIVELPAARPKRVVLLVSKEHHCLGDILIRHEFRELSAQIAAVISNHTRLESLVGRFGIPFHHVPVGDESREAQEGRIEAILRGYEPEYLVLAKYMRVLGPAFCSRYAGRMINIHHSFLPAFAGARPYLQAFERGVKIIGATAHFVTSLLDAGPIIVQSVVPVDHTQTPEDFQQAGRDVEQAVLARALRLVFEDRVFLCGNRTVIFD